jgi:hypothetical protein
MERHMSRNVQALTYTCACNGLKSRVQSGIETESRSLDTQMRGNITDMMLYIFKWMLDTIHTTTTMSINNIPVCDHI